MKYFFAFLLSGTACLIAEIILDNTKLTPGHLTSLYTVFGSLLSFLGVYDVLLQKCGAGASVLISNFGHLLYTGAISGYKEEGIIGLFTNMFSKSSSAITAVIIFSFIASLLFKAKD